MRILTSSILACTLGLLPVIGMNCNSVGSQVICKEKRTYKIKLEKDVVLGDEAMIQGKFGDAEKLYHDAIQRNPKSISGHVGYGMAMAKQFKLDAAETEFKKTLELDPQNAPAHAGLAMVMYNRLQSSNQTIRNQTDAILKNAEAEAKMGLNIDPGMPEAHYTLGNIYRTQGRLDEALNEFKEAQKNDPHFSEAFSGSGLVNLSKGDYASAVADFKQAISLASGNSTAHYGLGRTYFKQGLYDEALKELNTSLYQNRNSAPVWQTRGEIYAAQGNTTAAVQAYNESIRMKPENPDPYLGKADITESRGDLELAISDVRSGLALNPDSTPLHMRVADLSLKLEKLDDAIKEYSLVLEKSPQDAQAAQGLTRGYYLKANKDATSAFFVSNEYENAKGMIDKAVAMNPNNMELRLAQMKMRIMAGEPVDLKSIQPPTNDGERIAYAEALLAQDKFAEADQQMATVINNAPDAKSAFAVADLSLMIKDLKNAEAAFKKASTFPGGEARVKRGMNQVAKARDVAKQDLTLADDLSRKKQLPSAIDKYHASIYGDPKVPMARYSLASTLERVKPQASKDLKEAVEQYNAYIALSPSIPPKELEKLNKKIGNLKEKAYKLEMKEKEAAAKRGG